MTHLQNEFYPQHVNGITFLTSWKRYRYISPRQGMKVLVIDLSGHLFGVSTQESANREEMQ